MAWREKTAWIALLAMLAAYGAYFSLIRQSDMSPIAMLELFGGLTVVQIVVVILATAVMAILAGRDVRGRPDERDRAIARRGASVAYYVLLVGVIAVGVILPFQDKGWAITNAALLVLVAAETVRLIFVVVSYRRGWHG
jgi:hypothetical protein